MNIIKGKNETVKFKELACGDVFKVGEYIFIKIDDSDLKNAYNLVENFPTSFKNDEKVTKSHSELTVW